MEAQVFEALQGSLSAEPNTRMRSELNLKQLEHSDEFSLAAANVALAAEVRTAVRQAAIVQIRGYVNRHWSIGSTRYEPGPIPNQQTKSQVREKVFSLLTSSDRKIRTASAAVVSSMARYDWPDEWPLLFSQLVGLLHSGNKDHTHSAMCVFSEWVTNDMSEQHMEQLGTLLPELKRIFVSGSEYDTSTRVMAVRVFSDCIEIISNISFAQADFVDTHAPAILKEWMDPILDVFKQPISSRGGVSSIPLKAECAKAVVKAMEGFPKHVAPYNASILEVLWSQLKDLCDPYLQAFVYEGGEHSESAMDMLTFCDEDGEESSIDSYLLGIFEWVSKATERKSMRKIFVDKAAGGGAGVPTPFFSELVAVLMSYAQITTEMLEDWADDMDLFVADEDEEGYRFNVRVSVQELIQSLAYSLPGPLTAALWSAARQRTEVASQWRHQSNSSWWLVSEAVLWSIGIAASSIIEQQEDKKSSSQIDLGALFESVVWPLAQSAGFPFGQGRAFIFASSFAKVLPPNIAEAFVEASSKATADPHMHPAVRLSAVRAIGNFCRYLPSGLVKPHQSVIVGGLADVIPQLSEDSAHIALDAMHATLQDNQEISAALEPAISQSVIGVWQKYPGDVLLTSIVIDIVEDMARNPLAREAFTRRALPIIGEAITQSTEGMVVSSAIDLLSGLVKGGPSPMPSGYTEAIFPSLMQVLSSCADNEVLQSGQACLKYFVQKDADCVAQWRDGSGMSGLDHIIRFVAVLLAPDSSESSALFVGDLVSKIIQKCSQYIAGNVLAELIRVVTTRLATARTSSFCSSLLPLYAQLVVHYPSEVVDLLDQMRFGDQSGLQVVLAAWFRNYLDVQGYYNRKVSAVALTRLFLLGDPRVSTFAVQGDLIPNAANNGKIVTRSMSRTNPDQYTQIPSSAKIIKLLLVEIEMDIESLFARRGGAGLSGLVDEADLGSEGEDGDWEDDGDEDGGIDPLAELVPADQYGFLSDLVDGGVDFDEGDDDDDDDDDVLADPIYNQDLNETLGTFFREMVQNDQNDFHATIEPTLSAKERAIFGKVIPH
ncbi:ARM repeat-containing protein [Martensiomyces pterosporus]|nr:ARM repeat-containing protein [Martensiomyces pterosporus]